MGTKEKELWNEYIEKEEDGTKTPKKAIVELNKIKNFLDNNPNLQGLDGNHYQNSPIWNEIKKLTGWTFSMRAWGALMASYMNEKIGKRKYKYLDFYM